MEAKLFQYKQKFELESGEYLPELELAYHTYGKLNKTGDNVVWICHALTANSEVADWWPNMVGEGRLLDPEKYFIISVNIPSSCYGSTGPLSINPENDKPWYRSFPKLSFRDIVHSFELLRQELKIQKIHTIIGGSIGGFQALEYSIMFPELIERLVFVASSAVISPWAIAFNQTQRLAIEADPSFKDDVPEGGSNGLKAARAVALLSYRNEKAYNQTQVESDQSKTSDFKASSYQSYQGEKLLKRFDAYSYYAITQLMDTHNIRRGRGSLTEVADKIKAKVLSIGISSDLIFPTQEQKLLADITGGEYREIDSDFGHDGFLIETKKLSAIINQFWREEKYSYSSRPFHKAYNYEKVLIPN